MATNRKGMILAGGLGTRLAPLTIHTSKQLLPIYDKPMVYYPLSVLMLGQVREVLLISMPRDIETYRALLGDGSQFGISISYCVQDKPAGLAQSYLLGENFLAGSPSVLILGDNVFHGDGLQDMLRSADARILGASVFSYPVSQPSNFGIVEFASDNRVVSIEEKPQQPRSRHAITGLYFCDERAPEFAARVKPSLRGELEIIDVLRQYLECDCLHVEQLGRGFAWLDTGTVDGLLDAAQFIATLERRQGLKVACLEEIAFRNQWIDVAALERAADRFRGNSYGEYLRQLIEQQ